MSCIYVIYFKRFYAPTLRQFNFIPGITRIMNILTISSDSTPVLTVLVREFR